MAAKTEKKTTKPKREPAPKGNGAAKGVTIGPKLSSAQGKVLYLLQKAGSNGIPLTDFPGRKPTRSLKALAECGYAKTKKAIAFVTPKGAKREVAA